jgi:hypothetical protein
MTRVADRLANAASATFTESAAKAIQEGCAEIIRLEAQVATFKAMYVCAYNLTVCEKWLREMAESKLAGKTFPGGDDGPPIS